MGYDLTKSIISSFTVVPFRAAHYALTGEKGQPDCLSLLIKWETKTLFFWGDGIGYNGQIDLLSPFFIALTFALIFGILKLFKKP